jgi:hypothetical protein
MALTQAREMQPFVPEWRNPVPFSY